jgi:hypothetical protein
VAQGQREAVGGGGLPDAETVQWYDARYVKSMIDDPGNPMAAALFGSEAVNRLLAAMHGCLDLPPRSFA